MNKFKKRQIARRKKDTVMREAIWPKLKLQILTDQLKSTSKTALFLESVLFIKFLLD